MSVFYSFFFFGFWLLVHFSMISIICMHPYVHIYTTEWRKKSRKHKPPQLFPLLPRQRSHHPLESHQRHRVRGKRPQETRHEAPPVAPDAVTFPDRPGRVAPPREQTLPVAEALAEGVRHDALLDDVGGVGRDPEDLGGEAAGPEVDGGGGEVGGCGEEAGEEVVGAPPEEEEGAEQKGCG